MKNHTNAAQGGSFATLNDSELLLSVREGESEAYAELWRRHIRAALRLAYRIAPDRAEDLVSEAFLQVHHQLTVTGNGPDKSFRAYLFTTMRNTAMRWQREAKLVESSPYLDSIDYTDASTILEDRARSSELLEAFQLLPERWQRVLWLTEVEDVARPAIAAEFGIKPNAVSVLYRRARNGLRLQWLNQQVPPELRESRHHVAGLLPELIVTGKMTTPRKQVREHLSQCTICAELSDDMINAYGRMSRKTLGGFGFGALGVVLTTASQVTVSGTGAATAAALTLSSVAVAATLSIVVVMGTMPSQPGDHTTQQEQQEQQESHGQQGSAEQNRTGSTPPEEESGRLSANENIERDGSGRVDIGDDVDTVESPLISTPTGRGNIDPDIPSISVSRDAAPSDFYVPPASPDPLPDGATPDPSQRSGDPRADSTDDLRSGINTPTFVTGYLAPVLSGAVPPGAEVTVELPVSPDSNSQRFAAAVTAEGEWSFDLRTMFADHTGEFEYRVWAHTHQQSSPVDTGYFTITAPEVQGFESLLPFEEMPLTEFSETGIVFSVAGPPRGTVCLTSVWPGHTIEIPLDHEGTATKRIRFLSSGWYYLTFRACEDGHRGPAAEFNFDVIDSDSPRFTNFGPAPSETLIEVSDP